MIDEQKEVAIVKWFYKFENFFYQLLDSFIKAIINIVFTILGYVWLNSALHFKQIIGFIVILAVSTLISNLTKPLYLKLNFGEMIKRGVDKWLKIKRI